MSINNREELNNYYQYFNELVDEYTEKWKIRPSNLKRYLQPGTERFNKFLEKSKTKLKKDFGLDINDSYSRLVLQNVIEDRFAMEKDGVLNFDNYNLLESVEYQISSLMICLYKGLGKADTNYEKFLADFYDTNLSQISIVSQSECSDELTSMIANSSHLFDVTEWSNTVRVILWSKEDFLLISENIKEFLLDQLSSKEIEVVGLKINLKDLIDTISFRKKLESMVSEEFVINLITNCTEDFTYESKSAQAGYYLWYKNLNHVSS